MQDEIFFSVIGHSPASLCSSGHSPPPSKKRSHLSLHIQPHRLGSLGGSPASLGSPRASLASEAVCVGAFFAGALRNFSSLILQQKKIGAYKRERNATFLYFAKQNVCLPKEAHSSSFGRSLHRLLNLNSTWGIL
jgi:hypothetical protein